MNNQTLAELRKKLDTLYELKKDLDDIEEAGNIAHDLKKITQSLESYTMERCYPLLPDMYRIPWFPRLVDIVARRT